MTEDELEFKEDMISLLDRISLRKMKNDMYYFSKDFSDENELHIFKNMILTYENNSEDENKVNDFKQFMLIEIGDCLKEVCQVISKMKFIFDESYLNLLKDVVLFYKSKEIELFSEKWITYLSDLIIDSDEGRKIHDLEDIQFEYDDICLLKYIIMNFKGKFIQ